jgi:hypothetical protein
VLLQEATKAIESELLAKQQELKKWSNKHWKLQDNLNNLSAFARSQKHNED